MYTYIRDYIRGEKMKKRLIVLLLSVFMIMPFALFGCAKDDDHTCEFESTWTLNSTHHWYKCKDEDCSEEKDKAEHTYSSDNKCTVCGYEKQVVTDSNASKSDITTVVNAASDKMSDVARTVVGLSNETTGFDGITEDDGDGDSVSPAPVATASTNLVGYREATLSDFLYIQETPAMIVGIIDYILRNATIDNGYSDGFKLNHTYSGIADIGIGQGAMYFKMDEVENGITLNADLIGNKSGVDVQYSVNGLFTYDYTNNVVKSIELNYVILPTAYEFTSIRIDFVSNRFDAIMAYSNHTMDTTAGADFVTKFNNGQMSFENLTEYGFEYIDMCYGNLADNVNDYRFTGYSYEFDETDTQSSYVVELVYNGIYTNLKKLSLRSADDILVTPDATSITYLQDAITYGKNKSHISTTTNNGRTYYYMPFLEYEDMVTVLTEAKTRILADASAGKNEKDLITEALAYITHHGKETYIGALGTYNGLYMDMDLSTAYIYYNGEGGNYGFKEFATRLLLFSNNGAVRIEIILKENTILELNYIEICYKLLKDVLAEKIEFYDDKTSDEYLFLTGALEYYRYYNDNNFIYLDSSVNESGYYLYCYDEDVWTGYGQMHIRHGENDDYYIFVRLDFDSWCSIYYYN